MRELFFGAGLALVACGGADSQSVFAAASGEASGGASGGAVTMGGAGALASGGRLGDAGGVGRAGGPAAAGAQGGSLVSAGGSIASGGSRPNAGGSGSAPNPIGGSSGSMQASGGASFGGAIAVGGGGQASGGSTTGGSGGTSDLGACPVSFQGALWSCSALHEGKSICSGSSCVPCTIDQLDCNNDPTDGCEAYAGDDAHCGRCDQHCGVGQLTGTTCVYETKGASVASYVCDTKQP